MNLPLLIFIGGILHFGILLAGALAPGELDWKNELKRIDPLSRQIIWVHGAFIVLVIIAFGCLSMALSGDLASGSPLARALCLFVAVFWGVRLALQFFYFDATPHLKSLFLKVGYHGLTVVFAYHAVVYGYAAVAGGAG